MRFVNSPTLVNKELELKGKRCRLRTLSDTDVGPKYLEWLSDPDVNRFLEVRFAQPKSTEDLKRSVRDIFESPNQMLLGIFELIGNEHLGNVKLTISPHHKTAEVGYLLGNKAYWGKGLATEAVGLTMEWAFNELYVEKLFAGVYASNKASASLLNKLGFVPEARLHAEVINSFGKREDLLRFARFRGVEEGLLRRDVPDKVVRSCGS